MSERPARPLTETERLLVWRLLEARTGVARKMTLLVAFADLAFFVRMWARSTRSGMAATYVVCAVATLILAGIVAYFGWGLPRKMRQDLDNGVKREVDGVITRIARAPNAYGETVTSVTVGAVEMVTRADIFAQAREGQRVVVEYLPLSKVALMAHFPEESLARASG